MNETYARHQNYETENLAQSLGADAVLVVSLVRDPGSELAPVMTCVSQKDVQLLEMIGIVHKLAGDVNAQLQKAGLSPAFNFNVPGQTFFVPLDHESR